MPNPPKTNRRAVYEGLLGRPLGPKDGLMDDHVAYYLWHECPDTREGKALRADYEEDAYDALFKHYRVNRRGKNAERKLIFILAREAKVPAFKEDAKPRGRPPEDKPIEILHEVLAMSEYLRSQGAKNTGDLAACAALVTTPRYSKSRTRQLYGIVKRARRTTTTVNKAKERYERHPMTESVKHYRNTVRGIYK